MMDPTEFWMKSVAFNYVIVAASFIVAGGSCLTALNFMLVGLIVTLVGVAVGLVALGLNMRLGARVKKDFEEFVARHNEEMKKQHPGLS